MDRKEVRDYFARYAQKKNQGRFKRQLLKLEEFDMSYIGQEDWVHVDEYWKQVNQLEDQIADLKLEVESADDDEVYTLAQIYKALEIAIDAGESQSEQALKAIINLHRKEVREKAQQRIKSEV